MDHFLHILKLNLNYLSFIIIFDRFIFLRTFNYFFIFYCVTSRRDRLALFYDRDNITCHIPLYHIQIQIVRSLIRNSQGKV